MNAVGDAIFFLEQRFSENQSMHDREDAMFPAIVPFHLRTVREQLADSGVSFTSHRRLMSAHHRVQTAIQEHIEKGLVCWNTRNASRYLRGELDPFYASGPLRAAGEPLNVFGFHAEVLFKYSPYPDRSGHRVFPK